MTGFADGWGSSGQSGSLGLETLRLNRSVGTSRWSYEVVPRLLTGFGSIWCERCELAVRVKTIDLRRG